MPVGWANGCSSAATGACSTKAIQPRLRIFTTAHWTRCGTRIFIHARAFHSPPPHSKPYERRRSLRVESVLIEPCVSAADYLPNPYETRFCQEIPRVAQRQVAARNRQPLNVLRASSLAWKPRRANLAKHNLKPCAPTGGRRSSPYLQFPLDRFLSAAQARERTFQGVCRNALGPTGALGRGRSDSGLGRWPLAFLDALPCAGKHDVRTEGTEFHALWCSAGCPCHAALSTCREIVRRPARPPRRQAGAWPRESPLLNTSKSVSRA